MQPPNQMRLEKIKKVSSTLRMVCKALMVLATLAFLPGCIALLINRGGTIHSFNTSFVINELTLPSRLILFGIIALTFGIVFRCFFQLNQLLGNYSRGEIFTAKSAGIIRQLGITCVVWGVLNLISSFLPLVISPQHPKSFEGEFGFVVIGCIVIVISWFMEMAVELQEENDLTI
jgi:Protein of unknown function (DUF2975)